MSRSITLGQTRPRRPISYWVDGDATFPANAAIPSQGYCNPVEVVKECHLGAVASGATATVEVKVMVLTAGAITFWAESQALPGDLQSNNDYAEETTTVEAAPPANLAVTVQDTPNPVAVGQTVTYLVKVENAGPGTATEVKVSYSVAGDATFTVDTATASPGMCDPAAPVSECHLGNLASGDTATVEVQVTTLTLGTIEFEADAYTTAHDSQPGNDYDTEATAHRRRPVPHVHRPCQLAAHRRCQGQQEHREGHRPYREEPHGGRRQGLR